MEHCGCMGVKRWTRAWVGGLEKLVVIRKQDRKREEGSERWSIDLDTGGLRGSSPVSNDGDSTGGQEVKAQSIVGRLPIPQLLQRGPRPICVGQLHRPVPRCREGPQWWTGVAMETMLRPLPSPHPGEAAGRSHCRSRFVYLCSIYSHS